MEQEIFDAIAALRRHGIELVACNGSETRDATKMAVDFVITGNMNPIEKHAIKAAFENAWFGQMPTAPDAANPVKPTALRSVALDGTVREGEM